MRLFIALFKRKAVLSRQINRVRGSNRIALFVALLLYLPACSLTTPRDIGNDHRITLEALQATSTAKRRGGTLIVAYPSVPEALDTYRMALKNPSGTMDYYAGMRWADFLPAIMQQSLISTLERTGAYSRVISDGEASTGMYILRPQVEVFEAHYVREGAPPVWRVRIRAVFLDGNTLRQRHEVLLESSARALSDTRDGVTDAARRAYEDALRQLAHKLPG